MQKLRKALAISVMSVTVLSTSMFSVSFAGAATAIKAGDLIKTNTSQAVYYVGADMKKNVFPDAGTYFSWYSDFSGITVVSQDEFNALAWGGNVVYRPGTKLVKIQSDPRVYAVEPGGKLKHIPSEAAAAAAFGANWGKRVVDISDTVFVSSYDKNPTTLTTTFPAGTLVKGTAPDVFYFDGSAYRKIANEAAFTANRFSFANVVTTTSATTPVGTDITAAESSLITTAAGGSAVIGGSGVTVALSSLTPVSTSVPQNGSRVPMTKINLTASNDGAVTVNSITVRRIGLSSNTEIDKVWAERDGVVVASKKSVNTNDEAILTFSPALVVASGATVSLDLVASLLNAAGNIGLGIASASAISASGAVVSGSFPINGNQMSPIAYNVANLAITDPSSTALTPKVGDEQTELGKFTLQFNTSVANTNRDVNLVSITLKNNGTEDLAKTAMNLFLEQAGNKVSANTVVDGRFVTFYFPATTGLDLLKDDSSKNFIIKGDVIGKENTGTGSYVFSLNKSTDLVANEKSTGFGVNVLNTISGTAKADAFAISTVNISAGVISISKKSTSPSATTVVKGSDNTVLLANIRADEAINADGIVLTYGSSDVNAATVNQFENVRVFLNGVLLDSFDPSATSTGLLTQTIDSALTLSKGDNEVKVMARAKTNATSNSAFMAKLTGDAFDAQNPEYVSSGNAVNVTDDSIGGTATGGIFTVQAATLSVTRNDGFSDGKTIVKGSSDVVLGKFTLKAANDDVKVTSITFAGNNAASTTNRVAASSISDTRLFVDGVQVGNTVDFGTSGSNFSTLNFTVLKDTSKVIELRGSFDSSAVGEFRTAITVNAQDSKGTTVSGATPNTANFVIADAGTLNVELGGNTPAEAIIATKPGLEQEIAQIKLTAINDSINLTELNFVNTSSTTAAVATSVADSLVSAISLYDGTTLIDSTVLVAGEGKFITDNKVIVPANGTKTLSVKVKLNDIVNDAAATNKDIRFAVSTVNSKSSAGTATGLVSKFVLANNFRVRKTIPTVALAALPATLLTAGDQVVSKFTVTADSNGDVSMKQVVLTYATTSGSSIAGLANNAIKVNGASKDVASTLDVAAKTLKVVFATPEIISAGTTKTFEVLATLSVSGANAESVTTKIVEDTTYVNDGVGTTGNFTWSDGADIVTPTYQNGHRVAGLTTTTQVLSK